MESRTDSQFGAQNPRLISINLATIQTLLDTLRHLGSAYGPPSKYVITEDVVRGHLIQVSILQDETGWMVIARSDPPLDAIVSLHINHDIFHQEFSHTGEAIFGRIPEAWLRTPMNLVVTLFGPELGEE